MIAVKARGLEKAERLCNPNESPVNLLDARNEADGVKEVLELNRVTNVSVDEQRTSRLTGILPANQDGQLFDLTILTGLTS